MSRLPPAGAQSQNASSDRQGIWSICEATPILHWLRAVSRGINLPPALWEAKPTSKTGEMPTAVSHSLSSPQNVQERWVPRKHSRALRIAATTVQTVTSRHPKHHNTCLKLWPIDGLVLCLFNTYSSGSYCIPFMQRLCARQ